jgi:hypothetical protein
VNRIPVNQSWREFRNSDLCRPGVVMIMADGEHRLIGDVNPLGGYCDDCGTPGGEVITECVDILALVESALNQTPTKETACTATDTKD